MSYYPLFQYQNYTEPLFPIVKADEANFHVPWSEPVRQRIIPALAIALAVSGLFAPPMFRTLTEDNPTVNEAMRHQAWSEPIRIKPGLTASLQRAYTQGFPVVLAPTTFVEGWFTPFTDPVRVKPGLLTALNSELIYPFRLLPPPNVTALLSGYEVDSDAAIGAVNVLQSPAAGPSLSPGSVSIVEN